MRVDSLMNEYKPRNLSRRAVELQRLKLTIRSEIRNYILLRVIAPTSATV